MSVSLFNQKLKEARRDALVSHYLATHDFSSLPEDSSVTTADDLYEYLLLDTKISNAVTTSRLAEAISSLQLFIHRSLEGYEGELAEGATKYLAKDAFLDNWDIYNKRYSTWAGKEKLRFYAGNYVEPSLRTNKTTLFESFENVLNQGKLTSNQVVQALNAYISEYDLYANISYIYAGKGNEQGDKYYLTGKDIHGQYYWREVSVKDGRPVLWGQWLQLPAAIKEPVDNVIMSYANGGPCCEWYSEEKRQKGEGSSELVLTRHLWQLKTGNIWRDVSNSYYRITEVVDTEDTDHQYTWSIERTSPTGYNIYFSFENENNKGSFSLDVNIDALNKTISITRKDIILNTAGENVIFSSVRPDNDQHKDTVIEDGKSYQIDFESMVEFILTGSGYKELLIYFHVETLVSPSPFGPIWGGFLYDDASQNKLFSVSSPEIGGLLNDPSDDVMDIILTYDFQHTCAAKGIWYYNGNVKGGDAFSGPYGQYLWEIFFHIPYLIATRFATEQRFEEAERWYKYIFNSAGYRDEEGKMLTDEDGQPRYWNCYPLQQDVAWDSFAAMPASTDPDVIATTDPMHYKLAIFQHTLDLLIARGDAAYRLLERDTLTEAKMYYVQAQQLLGPRPDIRVTNSWDNPTLSDEASAIQEPLTLSAEGASLTFEQWLRAGDSSEMGDGNFLPPYNDVLLAYWDKLDIRLYNLRHNLSLDGQPLSLPLFATPVDPAELHRQQSGGDGVQGDVSPAEGADIGWRYPLLAAKAQESVNRLKEFGSGLLSALEKQDSEKVTMLLQSQQSSVLGLQQEIAQKNLDILNAELAALNSSREGLVLNQKYYTSLINGALSAAEIAGLALRSSSMLTNSLASVALIPAGALRAIPNIFGMADGGADMGAPIEATAQSMQIAAQVFDQSAAVSEITASYQRRAADWRQQSELVAKSIEETDNRIDSLKAQIAMQQKQIALAEMEYANQQAYLDLYNSCFTGLTLYSWMVSRLSSLYYQLYDATIPVCIQAREALKRELGNSRTDGIFSTPVWNDLYQGLLAGEGLTTELQKLENVWIQNSANGLEAMRTVSLAAVRGEESGSLSASIASVLNNVTDNSAVGKLTLNNNIFSAVLDMSTLQLADDYGPTSSDKSLFTKSIAVTLPTLLGPYQDIAATLSDDKGTVATLSHGMQDTGRFVVNLDDSRFLPFEGRDPTTMTLTLSIFNVKGASDAAPNQRSIVENLSDIIFHIRYIMRNQQS